MDGPFPPEGGVSHAASQERESPFGAKTPKQLRGLKNLHKTESCCFLFFLLLLLPRAFSRPFLGEGKGERSGGGGRPQRDPYRKKRLSFPAAPSSPVLAGRNDAVLFGDGERGSDGVLMPLDLAQQHRPAALRPRVNLGRHLATTGRGRQKSPSSRPEETGAP